jgi:hypothetical protein
MDSAEACRRIHELIERLPIWREPSDSLPRNGLYFFYEVGEYTSHTGGFRIVRVGTHGAGRTLRQRLNDHYFGNREGSIFRKHLGSALLKISGAPDEHVKEWMKRRKGNVNWHKFDNVENEVSAILHSRFHFKVVKVDDLFERKNFEEKIIATLVACPVCKPSEKWLGRFAWSIKVRESGLWNSNYVNSPWKMTESDLALFGQRVRETLLMVTDC